MALGVHTDRNPHGKILMQHLNAAKEILLDPSRRAQYDRELPHRQGGENNGVGSSSAEEERLRSVLESTLAEKAILKREVKELRSMLELSLEEKAALKREADELRSVRVSVVLLEQKIEEQEGQITVYEDKLDRVSRELRMERQCLSTEQHNHGNLRRELKKVEKQRNKLKETNKDLKRENEELASEVDHLEDEMEDTSKELKNVKKKNSQLGTTASEYLSKHNKMVDAYEEKVDRINRELREARHNKTHQNERVFKFMSTSCLIFTVFYIFLVVLSYIRMDPEGGETNQYTLSLFMVYSVCYCIFWVLLFAFAIA